ncbi:MAG: DeoR family transcriptional regulator [[Clostridium] innocuum]
MTARRDLMELEQMGALIRTHGGAIAKEKKP